ncbi:MAG: glycosyltransferase family 2 protein [Deltaproteobacteria bacterium]|nr:MAG: glycosyltransferase family 2 protein [Deltaproteobacteria bacterium]
MRLSVTVIALNEEENIVPCLESVRFSDEIIVVVDSGSTDRTLELARNFTDRIFIIDWRGFAGTKNFAVDQASGDWVFSLDADERVSEGLRREILDIIKADGPWDGYRVPRKNYVGNRWIRHLGWYPDYTLRLFRRGRGRFRDREVHEEVEVAGPVGLMRTPLEHYSYRSLEEYAARQDRYARLAAQEMRKAGRRPVPGELLWRPALTFFKLFLLKRGFLEGALGLKLACESSRYNFLKYHYLRTIGKDKDHEH